MNDYQSRLNFPEEEEDYYGDRGYNRKRYNRNKLRKALLVTKFTRQNKALNVKFMEDKSLMVSLGGTSISLTMQELLVLKKFLEYIEDKFLVEMWKREAEDYNRFIEEKYG